MKMNQYISLREQFILIETFIRLKIFVDKIQTLTKTNNKQKQLKAIDEDGSVTTEVQEVNNVRTRVALILDGLPHEIAIDMKNVEKNLQSIVQSNIKLFIEIKKYFGTSLCRPESNYFKLYRFAIRVFVVLFHIIFFYKFETIE